MKNIVKIFWLICIWNLLPGNVLAQQQVPQQPHQYKIGFVNTGVVLKEAPQAKQVEESLKAEFLAREKILKQKKQELLDLEQRINSDDPTMTPVIKRKLERELRLKLSQLKFEQQEFKQDQNIRRNEEIRKLQTVIAKVLKQLGDEQKFDLILTEGVSYVSDAIDITPKIITMLKKLQEQEQKTRLK